ncbi:hypothetical protein [Coxiella burnetii]|uniref:hypothetical protein n=1 Tax=Coxiella burnetii TaxID=777 RepID=UPI000509417C|nr:hypothetical protein [Coxiella burnetii]AIT64075.1 hypothetical protein CBNA_1874 [Coxiella burnetii str. Namibia]ATN86590.1 hypothetical protein AYO29_09310 [Coxiella burnetii str. Schperling]PHH56732.1 hypothetical protein CRH12_09370 [Coxiella burnetii]
MRRKSACEKFTETLVRSLAVFSIFSNPETMASAKVTPLPNLNPIGCETALREGKDNFVTVITGFESCPYYDKLLFTFGQACEELKRDCFSFIYTSEENPQKYNPALNTKTVLGCLGYIPVASPLLSQHLRVTAPDPLGKQMLGPLNLGGGLNGYSTVEEVKSFINELPGNWTGEDFKHLRLSR